MICGFYLSLVCEPLLTKDDVSGRKIVPNWDDGVKEEAKKKGSFPEG